MFQRRIGILFVLVLVAIASTGVAKAQYYDEEGFFLFLDAVLTTPQDTDQLVATIQDVANPTIQRESRPTVDWGSEPAGEIGFGYRWPNGSKVTISYWQFDNDERIVGDGVAFGYMNFAIGPASLADPFGTGYYEYYGSFGYPGHYDIVADIEATSIEATFSDTAELSETLSLEWSVGVRYAKFEETLAGFYDYCSSDPDVGCGGFVGYFGSYFGDYRYGVRKANEGEATGFKLGLRGEYALNDSLSINGGLAYSFMDGEVTGASSQAPIGLINQNQFIPPASVSVADDNRSGTIRDFDLAVVYHLFDDRYRIWLGYEQSEWQGMVADLTRNTSGSFLVQPGRDRVVFSGFRIGASVRF
jgi:hypothetical protein